MINEQMGGEGTNIVEHLMNASNLPSIMLSILHEFS